MSKRHKIKRRARYKLQKKQALLAAQLKAMQALYHIGLELVRKLVRREFAKRVAYDQTLNLTEL